ncbi:hypothetical protein BK809_0001219 [Diplodia seriata]|uniref:Heterokaryon incompatibility domain-containing protein n=1 Tax=Diplodia seriata TaxID=420778 RepID=A0A1S8B670_9PEZI|nr:hypothetical protein BK809_0001219 [Diplodia seriata]
MARKLGIRYVWIDAVCIIQDDKEDWALEAPLMARLYRESALTLSISTALDDNGPAFITTRPPADLPFKHPQNAETSDFFVRIAPSHVVPHRLYNVHGGGGGRDRTGKDRPAALAQKHPVFARGWCYQERLLSRRVLHYTADEFVWQCQSATWCECGAASCNYASSSSWPRIYGILQASLPAPDLPPLSFEDWRRLVHEFSWNALTFDSDVFPAFSGLAHAYQDKVGRFATGRYLAGHWEADLPHSLLWHSLDARDSIYLLTGMSVTMINSRRSPDVAPSWSWASMKGPVRWPTEGIFTAVNEYECGRAGLEVEYAEVQARCTLKTADEMGQLAGEGQLTVKTRVVQEVLSVFLNFRSELVWWVKEPPYDDVLYASKLAGGKEAYMSVFLDTVEDKNRWRDNNVWFARLCKVTRAEDAELGEEATKWRRRTGTVALMLHRRDDGKFRRVGIATSPRKRINGVDVGVLAQEVGDAKEMIEGPADSAFDEWFDSVEDTEICIV